MDAPHPSKPPSPKQVKHAGQISDARAAAAVSAVLDVVSPYNGIVERRRFEADRQARIAATIPPPPEPPPPAPPAAGSFMGETKLPDPLKVIDGGGSGLKAGRMMIRRMEAEMQVVEAQCSGAQDAFHVFKARGELLRSVIAFERAEVAEAERQEARESELMARESARQIREMEMENLRLTREELRRRAKGAREIASETVRTENAVADLEAEPAREMRVSPAAFMSRIRQSASVTTEALETRTPGIEDGARKWDFGKLSWWGRHPKMGEILQALASGRTAQSIAEVFGLSPTTVARLREKWREKFGESPPTPVGGRRPAHKVVPAEGDED